jgi:2-hydroxychromene-2-carboxylate isomerase
MNEQNNSPFRDKPIKAAYMWRDIERRAGLYGIPFHGPAPYPIQEAHLANQIAVLGAQEGGCADYTSVTYRRWFLDSQEPGSEPNLSETLLEIGQDPERIMALARSGPIVAALDAATDQARQLTIFGSPSFVVDREVFWGDDRLDDALAWARFGTLRQAARG